MCPISQDFLAGSATECLQDQFSTSELVDSSEQYITATNIFPRKKVASTARMTSNFLSSIGRASPNDDEGVFHFFSKPPL